MPYNQSASTSSVTFGTYNDIAGNQVNNMFQGSVSMQTNIFNQDSNIHGTLIRELRDRLGPSNLSGNNRPQCLEDTRLQTLQSIDEWVNARWYPNVLLLIGAAGMGKSTIATTVAGKYQRSKQLGCHIFFLRGSSDPGNVIESIAYSLSVYSQTIAKSLVKQMEGSGDLGPSNLKTKFDILIRDSLSSVAADVSSPILIVLDALDECGTSETRQSLINVLQHGLPSLPQNFRFLLTSRPEHDILSFSLSSPGIHTIKIDHNSEENRCDVHTYIKHELEKLRSSNAFVIPQDWSWDEGIQSLVDTADGLFIWASTAIKFISGKKLGRFRHLKNLVENGRTLGLNELYATILENAFEWDDEEKDTFVRVFSLILFGRSPLSDEAINGILGIDTASEVLSYLHSVVVYEPGNPITIRHASFYDYLVSCKEMPWYIDSEVQKAYIASKCLERMEDLLRYNICKIPSSFVFNKNVPGIDNLVSRYIHPFLKYICCNWARHLQDVPYSQELCSQLRSFVYNQLLFWFEVLSLTSTFNDHVGPALLLAIDWVGNNDPELSSFLRDAYRQASTYSEPISQSVLQIYTSLLPLTKEESLMSIHYSKYANDAFRVEYIGRKRRNDCIKTIPVERGHSKTKILLLSPDGTRILSNSKQGVCVWDATSGELIAGPLEGSDELDVLSATYSTDGRYIIGVSTNGIIRKWDVLTSCLVWEKVTVRGQINSGWMASAVFSPDTKSVVFGDTQGSIGVWDVDTGERDDQLLGGHSSSIRCLSFSSDGKYLASGSKDTTIIIWDTDKREARTGPLRGHTERVTAVDFSKDGSTVISGSEDKSIYIWDVNSGKELRKIICKEGVYSVSYSPDGLFILAGGWRWIHMWNVVDAMAAPKVFQVDEFVWRASFSPEGNRFVSGSSVSPRDTIQIWDASWSLEETKAIFEEQQEEISSITLSPSGKFIASGFKRPNKGSIYLWNALTGELVKKLELSRGVISVSFSPINEHLIAFVSWLSGTVQVWDVTNNVVATIRNHESPVTSIALSPSNEKHVAFGSVDATICIWNIERRELEVRPSTGHSGFICAIVYSPDGTRLVSSSVDNTVRIWKSETGQLLSTLNGHSGCVNSVAYSSDGSCIVSGSDDKTIIVWDAESGQIICGPINAGDYVRSVCFSRDGKQILSGSTDDTVRVWDSLTGQPLLPPFIGYMSCVNSICFFPNERRFATGSEDGTIRIWTLDTVPTDTTWRIKNDNWVVSESGKLMMWIPTDLRRYLCHYRNISIINRPFYLKLHFNPE
ncbi:nucleotide-binding-oligomerization-domain like receptor [Pyrrhoderma noxium]|uniref:Nucleotide-binding-oligomerization-domain like receptor n=1 Tax=Pyrrhoderma noxium TaxID=2282107 RepID=A0A286UPK3_9AGAM|nr:nucleotide-binding-oligomerization-domain like receptor [Pyrrhoderma noxium]